MRLPLVIRRKTRVDFDEAIDEYKSQPTSLGVILAERVRTVLEAVAAPELHRAVYRIEMSAGLWLDPRSITDRVRGYRDIVGLMGFGSVVRFRPRS